MVYSSLIKTQPTSHRG